MTNATENSAKVTPPRWNLSDLYAGDNDPCLLADVYAAEKTIEDFAAKWQGRTDHLTDPRVLREALDELEALDRVIGTGDKPTHYLSLRRAMDQNDPELKGLATVVNQLETKTRNKIVFFWLNVGKIATEVQAQMLEAPELEPYRRLLERRFRLARYDLGEEATQVLSLMSPTAIRAWSNMLDELLAEKSVEISVDGVTKTVPFNAAFSLLADLKICDNAAAAISDALKGVAKIAEHEINAVVTTLTKISEKQGYPSPAEDTYMGDDLDPESVEAMLEAVEAGYPNVHEFYKFKAQLLGRTDLTYANRNAAYGELPTGFSWNDAVTAVRKVYAGLDPWFAEQFDQALATGHIDAEAREGKRGGAACWHSLIGLPTYLMLSFTGTIGDIETVAHEFGHYLNNLLMQLRCNAFTYGTTRPLAEVSSIFVEQSVLEAMLADADDETRLTLLMQSLEGGVGSIFRQTAAMRFEQALYREIKARGYLPLEDINGLFVEHMGAYLGEGVKMEEGSELWWIYWGHFRAQFYNYSYAFANLVAKALHAKVSADPNYINEVKRFMGAGTTLSPRDLLASMKMDITDVAFWQTGLDEWENTFEEVQALARKLGKI